MPRKTLTAVLAAALLAPALVRADDAGEKIVAKVRAFGGAVERDEARPGKPVVAVALAPGFASEDEIAALKAFPELRRLRVEGGLLGDVVSALPALAGLEELDLVNGRFIDFDLPDLSALKKLQKLKKFRFARPDTSRRYDWKEAFAVLADIKSLEVLDLSGVKLDTFGDKETLEPLKKLLNLRELILEDTALRGDALKPLAGLTGLRVLDLSGVKLGDKEVAALKGLKDLERLELRGSVLTGAGLAAFPMLRRLSLCPVDAAAVKAVAALPAIEDLSLAAPSAIFSLRSDALRPLAGAKTLRRLDLSGQGLDEKVFALLKDLPALEELDVSLTNAARKDPGALDGFKALKVLRAVAIRNETGPGIVMSETAVKPGVTDEALARFAALPALEHLDLTGTAVTDAGLKPLAAHPKLRRLVLDRTKVTDAGLKTVAALPALRRLELSGTAVTDAGLAALKAAPALDELDVSRTKVTDVGMKTVGAMTRLVDLNLSGTAVTDAGLAALADLQKLSVLVLRDLKLSDAALPHLAKLKELRTVCGGDGIDFLTEFNFQVPERSRQPVIPGLRVIR